MTRLFSAIAAICVAGSLGLAAQAGTSKVEMKNAEGKSVGTATISAGKMGGISIALDLMGLPPGDHAIHVHQVAKCEAPFTSAGGHFNPMMKQHGMQNPAGSHAGDMVNITVAANGTVKTTVANANVVLGEGANSLFTNGGTALMIHADADDMKTDPTGNAGGRIACGTITK